MKITCVGGGPSGMYFAILAKLRDRRHDVTVVERNKPGTTHGWGVSWSDELLDELYSEDPVTGRRLRAVSREWNGQKVCIDDHAPAVALPVAESAPSVAPPAMTCSSRTSSRRASTN